MKQRATAQAAKRPIRLALRRLIFLIILLICLGTMVDFQALAATTGRGYLTTAQELRTLRQQANLGAEPVLSVVTNFLINAGNPTDWPYGTAGREYLMRNDICSSSGYTNSYTFLEASGGAQGAYEKMIAYYLTNNINYAITARRKILDLTLTYGFGGNDYSGENECILELAFAIPLWIQAADLLQGTTIWTNADRRSFQTWLANQVYPKVVWASLVRRNNWGSAGSVAAAMIGDYLHDYSGTLRQIQPAARTLTPFQAYQEANANQLARMNAIWEGDSQCSIWGIQSYGGIPDELRRGSTGCDGRYLTSDDSARTYQILEVDHFVFHGEFLRRRGDMSIYNNIDAQGRGSLLRAILFVIANPVNPSRSYDWTLSKRSVLIIANVQYRNAAITTELGVSTRVRRGAMSCFGEVTHVIATRTVTATPLPATIPSGSTFILNPVADSHVNSSNPSGNFGTSSRLQADTSPVIRSYLRFTIPTLTQPIVSVTLRIYTKSAAPQGFLVHYTSNAWTETTLNYSNAPALGPLLATRGAANTESWAEVSLTSYVRNSGSYNFVLVAPNSTILLFASREAVNKPQLVVVTGNSSLAADVQGQGAVTASPTSIISSTMTLMPTESPTISTMTLMPTESPALTATLADMASFTPVITDTATLLPDYTATMASSDTPIPTETELPTETATELPTATALPTETATETSTSEP